MSFGRKIFTFSELRVLGLVFVVNLASIFSCLDRLRGEIWGCWREGGRQGLLLWALRVLVMIPRALCFQAAGLSSCGSSFWNYSLISLVSLSSAGQETAGNSSFLTQMR